MMVRSGPSREELLNFLSVVVGLLTESFTSKYPRLLSLRMKVGLQNKKGPFVVKVYILQLNRIARAWRRLFENRRKNMSNSFSWVLCTVYYFWMVE